MVGVGVVSFDPLITGDAEQGSPDGSPLPFGQGHGGQGLGVPGSGGHRFGSFGMG